MQLRKRFGFGYSNKLVFFLRLNLNFYYFIGMRYIKKMSKYLDLTVKKLEFI